MKFVKLDHQVLLNLKEEGYNVLRSNSPMTEENPTWIPDTFDLDKFFDLDSDEVAKRNIPLEDVGFPKLRLCNFTKFSSN